MKICFITSSFPRYEDDTSAPWLFRLCDELSKKGLNISIFAPSYKGLKQKNYRGLPVYRFRYFFAPFETLTHDDKAPAQIHRFFYKIIIAVYAASGCVNSFFYFIFKKYDIIGVHWPFPQALFGIIGKYLTGAKLVYHFYASELLLIKQNRFTKMVFNFLMLFADGVVTISSFTAGLVNKEIGNKIQMDIIPYGSTIPEAMIKQPEKTQNASDNPINLLFAGRLIERKGLMYLLKAAKILNRQNVPFSLAIVGDGYQKELLAEYISLNHLDDKVVLKGEISVAELVNEYRKCDIFIFPSIIDKRGDTEGLGCAAIEALMFKKPVIASNVGGIVDIIYDNKTGFLVPEKDASAIVNKILFVRDNYILATKLAEAGHEHVKENFSWNTITAKFIKTYKGYEQN